MTAAALDTTMGKARELKRRADTALEEIFRSFFEEIDTDRIRREVEELRVTRPDVAPAMVARALTRRTAIRCAAAGALTGLPGGLAAVGALGADLAYLIYQQFRLVLGIAAIYGHEPSSRERIHEALHCIAYASGVGVGKQGLATVLESAAVQGGLIAEKIGSRFVRDRVTHLVPVVGAVAGGMLNYAAVQGVARAAVRYYQARADQVDPVVAEEIWAEGDREHA